MRLCRPERRGQQWSVADVTSWLSALLADGPRLATQESAPPPLRRDAAATHIHHFELLTISLLCRPSGAQSEQSNAILEIQLEQPFKAPHNASGARPVFLYIAQVFLLYGCQQLGVGCS